MSYLESNLKTVPTGWRKLFYMNWPLIILLTAVASAGFLMLYSVAGGNLQTWAEPQMKRFALGLVAMFVVAFVPIWFWRNVSALAYFIALLLLIAVEFFGAIGMGAQRWLEIGPVRIQPSELMKVTLVMLLAAYYDWLPVHKVSRPQWVLVPALIILLPTFLVLAQPDLGTAVMLVLGGAFVMFAAGVSFWYFGTVIALVAGLIFGVMESRGTPYQLLHDYQYKRIDTFLDPGSDPLGAGYNIMQAQIALGSGGWSGRGFMQGTQSRLNFLPEKHTDFIFTTLAEEFGFVGAFSLLMLYAGIIAFALYSALSTRDRYASLLSFGVAGTFFFFFAINMAMVMGLMPVVGVPLPLVSYGGTAMLILLAAFGLVQSAHIHRPRQG
ncbi:rod shape-determining protein RodA [Thioclava sp. BHET1]|uniref:Peptidoglycan glycosyltransferase MrdB n=1 Tax=Thioclava dalianensis TaxID=1185766 RepID=A0A074TMJ9_9RHOB|nr:rod shape-determining protein RodA [Thioclava dalianensis]KEP70208.1 cell wall shape-determining protein [Thioclava dalianensis]TMV88254.1 rod shape-determining protein RodA [Thioclava sp. BHET1]SFM81915.1 rod shape determining protein RodA [Thioclava dalianensis]